MKDYVARVTESIRQKRLRQALADELADHVQSKTELYISRGFDEETAREKANADMGETAETVREQLETLHRAYLAFDVLFHLAFFGALAVLSFYGFYVLGFFWIEPYAVEIGAPVVCCCMAAAAVSSRRGYTVLPVFALIYALVFLPLSASPVMFWLELLSGNLRGFRENAAVYRLAPSALTCVFMGLFACGLLAAVVLIVLHNVKVKRAACTPQSLRRAKRAAVAVSVAGVLLLAGLLLELAPAFRVPQPWPEKLVVAAADRDLSGLDRAALQALEDGAAQAADYEIYSFYPYYDTLSAFADWVTDSIECSVQGERGEYVYRQENQWERISPFSARLLLPVPPVQTEKTWRYFTVFRIEFQMVPDESASGSMFRDDEKRFSAVCEPVVPGESLTISANGNELVYTVSLINGKKGKIN